MKQSQLYQENADRKIKRDEKMCKKKVILLVLAIFSILFLNSISAPNSYDIIGNSVVFDNNKLFLNVTPHTLFSSGNVEFELISKIYSGNVNAIWGFDTSQATPIKAEFYNPKEIQKEYSYICPTEFFNYSVADKYAWCFENITLDNETYFLELIFEHDFLRGNLASKTIYWNESYVQEWQDISSKFKSFNYQFDGKNKWFYLDNININANQIYKIRAYIKIPVKLGKSEGKYDFAIYPSSYGTNILQAHNDGKLFLGDPWWNSSYLRKTQINFTEQSGNNLTDYSVLISIPYYSDMNSDFSDLRFLDESETYELDWAGVNTTSVANTTEGFLPVNIDGWIKMSIPELGTNSTWMYYENPLATSTSNENTTFILYASTFNDWEIINGSAQLGTAMTATSNFAYADKNFTETKITGFEFKYEAFHNTFGINYVLLANSSYQPNRTPEGFFWQGIQFKSDTELVFGGGNPIDSPPHVIGFINETKEDPVRVSVEDNLIGMNVSKFSDDAWISLTYIRNQTGDYRMWITDTIAGVNNEERTLTNGTNPNTFELGGFFDKIEWEGRFDGDAIDSIRLRHYTEPEPSFSFGLEESYPEINSISPANSSGTSNINITFNYNITATLSITNCSFFVNAELNQTDETITKNVTQNFTLDDLGTVGINWSINCFDSDNNEANSDTWNVATILIDPEIFSGNTTNISLVDDISNISNFILENPDFGSINFTNIDLSAGADITLNVNITNLTVQLASENISSLNVSAEIKLYNVNFTKPRIIADGKTCSNDVCTQVSYNGTKFIFDVNHFTEYKIEDTPTRDSAGPTGSTVTTLTAYALIKHNNDTRDYTDRQRAVIYAVIKSYSDLYEIGLILSNNQTEEMISLLKNKDVDLNKEEMKKWFEQFQNNAVEEVTVTLEDISKYSLIKIATVEVIELNLNPKQLASIWFYNPGKPFTWNIKANQDLSSCEIKESNMADLECNIIDNSTAEIVYKGKINSLYSSILAEAELKSIKGANQRLPISIKIYNLRGKLWSIPVYFILLGIISIGLASFFTIKFLRKKEENE